MSGEVRGTGRRRLEDWSSSVWGSSRVSLGTYGEINPTAEEGSLGRSAWVPPRLARVRQRQPWTGQTGYVARESTTLRGAVLGPTLACDWGATAPPSGVGPLGLHTWSVYRIVFQNYITSTPKYIRRPCL